MRFPSLTLAARGLLVDLRDHKQNASRTVLVAALILVVVSVHNTSVFFGAPGQRLFVSLTGSSFFAVTMLGVGTFSAVIAEEREQDTLGLLRLAGFGAGSILLGKVLGVLVSFLVLLALSLPFATLCVTLGGVSTDQVGCAYLVLAGWILLLGAIGLVSSVLFLTPMSAARFAGFLVALLLFGASLIQIVGLGLVEGLGFGDTHPLVLALQDAMFEVASWSPWSHLSSAERDGDWEHAVWSVTCYAIASLVMFVVAWWAFPWSCRREVRSGGAKSLVQLFGSRGQQDSQWSESAMGAIAAKDRRYLHGGRMGFLMRGIAVVVGLWLVFDQNSSGRTRGAMAMAIGVVAIAVEGGGVASRMVRGEMRTNTLSSLALLPMSLPALLWTKVRAGLPLLLPGFTFLVVGFLAQGEYWPDAREAGTMLLAMALVVLAGITCWVLTLLYSLRLSRTSFGAAICTMAGGFLLMGFVMSRSGGRPEGILFLVDLCLFIVIVMLVPAIVRRVRTEVGR